METLNTSFYQKYSNLTNENLNNLQMKSKNLKQNIQDLPLNYIQQEKKKLRHLLTGYLTEKKQNLKDFFQFQDQQKNFEKRMQLTETLKELRMKLKNLIIESENLSKKSKDLNQILKKEEALLMKLQNKVKLNGLEING